jgi:heme-degrading monooxygenase HmoA
MIARRWNGAVRTQDAEAYVRYMESTGVEALRATPGNLGVFIFRSRGEDAADGRTRVEVVSLWEDLAAIHAFAGRDVSVARFFPEDEGYLVEREETVRHELATAYGIAGG